MNANKQIMPLNEEEKKKQEEECREIISKYAPIYDEEETTSFSDVLKSYAIHYFSYTIFLTEPLSFLARALLVPFSCILTITELTKLLRDRLFTTLFEELATKQLYPKTMMKTIINYKMHNETEIQEGYLSSEKLFALIKQIFSEQGITINSISEGINILIEGKKRALNSVENEPSEEIHTLCKLIEVDSEQNDLEIILTDPLIFQVIRLLTARELHPEILLAILYNEKIVEDIKTTPKRNIAQAKIKFNIQDKKSTTIYKTPLENTQTSKTFDSQESVTYEQLQRALQVQKENLMKTQREQFFKWQNENRNTGAVRKSSTPYIIYDEQKPKNDSEISSTLNMQKIFTEQENLIDTQQEKIMGMNKMIWDKEQEIKKLRKEYSDLPRSTHRNASRDRTETMRKNYGLMDTFKTTQGPVNFSTEFSDYSCKETIRTLPTFDGTGTFNDFYAEVSNLQKRLPSNEEERLLRVLYGKIKGEAARSIRGYDFATVNELMTFLETWYGSDKTYFELTGELAKLKQGKERINIYTNKVKDLMQNLMTAAEKENRITSSFSAQLERDMMKYYKRGLRTDIQLRIGNVRSFNELAQTAKIIESELGTYDNTPIKTIDKSVLKIETKKVNNIQGKNKNNQGIEPCKICGKNNHKIENCFRLKELLAKKEDSNKVKFPTQNQNIKILYCNFCQKTNHTEDRCFLKNQQKNLQTDNTNKQQQITATIVCQICKKPNHDASKCFFRNNIETNENKKLPRRDERKFCHFHQMNGHATEECLTKKRLEQAGNASGSQISGAIQGPQQ